MEDYEDDVVDGTPGQGTSTGALDANGKRRRVQRACDSCRKKKVKCDGGSKENPCALCRNNGTECTYQEIAKKRGPPKGYVEQLERRLETMEKLLRSLAPEADLRHVAYPPSKSSVLTEGALLTQTLGTTAANARSAAGPSNINSFRQRANSSHPSTPSAEGVNVGADGASPSDSAASNIEDGPCDMAALAASVAEMEIDGRYSGRSSSLDLARTVAAFRHAMSPLPPSSKPVDQMSTWDEMVISRQGITIKGRAMPLAEELLEREEVKPENLRLPDDALARILIDNYFKYFNPLQPIVHRPSFMRRYEAGDVRADVQFCGLCLAIFALGSRFSDDPRVLPTAPDIGNPSKETLQHCAGINFFIDSGKCMANYLRAPSVVDVQILLLGVMWHFGAANPVGAWTVLGYGLRRALDIGLHRRSSRRYNATLLDDEMRKRVWFALEWWDMYLSIGLGRPLGLTDDDVDLDLPLEVSDEDLDALSASGAWQPPFDASSRPPPPKSGEPTHVAGLIANYRLKNIAVKIVRTIYTRPPKSRAQDQSEIDKWEQRTVAELDSALNKWLDQVPVHLRWSASLDAQWMPLSGIIYVTYYGLQILVHRVFLAPERRGLLNFPSLAICTNAARSCSHVLETLRERKCLQQTYFVSSFSAITAGMVLLISVYGSGRKIGDLSVSAMEDVNKCMRVLEELKDTTFVATHCWAGMLHMSDIINLDRSAKEAAAANAATSTIAPTHGVKRRQREDDDAADGRGSISPTTQMYMSPGTGSSPHLPHTDAPAYKHPRNGSSHAPQPSSGPINPAGNGWSLDPGPAQQLFDLPFNTNELSSTTFGGDATFGSGFMDNTGTFMGLGQQPFMLASMGVNSIPQAGAADLGMGGFGGFDSGRPGSHAGFDAGFFPPYDMAGSANASGPPTTMPVNTSMLSQAQPVSGMPGQANPAMGNWNAHPTAAGPDPTSAQWEDWLFGARSGGLQAHGMASQSAL